jgi:hypothetical protein
VIGWMLNELHSGQQREVIKCHDAGEPVKENARSFDVRNSTTSRLAA